MDKVYDFPKSELVNIREFFEQYRPNLVTDSLQTNDEIAKILKLNNDNDEKFIKLEKSVSLDLHLSQIDDSPIFDFKPDETVVRKNVILEVSKEALNLNTFAEVIKYKEKNYGSPFGISAFSYRKINSTTSNSNQNLEPYSDVVISIRFYRPYRFMPGKPCYGPKFAEEFLVLGSQYLCELRDRVTCISNNKRLVNISDDPHQEIPDLDINPGFFFITSTFYNDTRNPQNPDYSEVIREWSKTRKEFQQSSLDNSAKMEETKFFDLAVHFGFPQVYQHHGNCEHLFTFSSMRLLSSDDVLRRESYPLLNTVAFPNAKLCNTCAGREYTFVVKNSQRQFHDPCYLCRLCFESFYYIQGEKIGDFEAYKLNTNKKRIYDDEDDFDLDLDTEDSEIDEN